MSSEQTVEVRKLWTIEAVKVAGMIPCWSAKVTAMGDKELPNQPRFFSRNKQQAIKKAKNWIDHQSRAGKYAPEKPEIVHYDPHSPRNWVEKARRRSRRTGVASRDRRREPPPKSAKTSTGTTPSSESSMELPPWSRQRKPNSGKSLSPEAQSKASAWPTDLAAPEPTSIGVGLLDTMPPLRRKVLHMKITIEIDGERPSAKRMWQKWKKRRCNREGHDWGEVREVPWTDEDNSPIYMVYRDCHRCGFNQRARSEQPGYSFDSWHEAAARRRN